MKEITSPQNALIKETKLLLKNKQRELTQTYLIEGEHLVEEALQEGQVLQKLFVTSDFVASHDIAPFEAQATESYHVSESALKAISSLPTPQGIVAVVAQQPQKLPEKLTKPLLILDAVQDPGNVGTMIRTADAAGFGAVVLGKGCADIYSNKVQRALQGSHFHLPVIKADLNTLLPDLKAKGVSLYGTALDKTAKSYKEVRPQGIFGVIVGNEGQGVSKTVLALVDQTLYIPMPGQAESLNVAVAAGILMFHLL